MERTPSERIRWWEPQDTDIPTPVVTAATRPTTYALPISLAHWRRSPWPDRPHP
jgi:hypothetical protein